MHTSRQFPTAVAPVTENGEFVNFTDLDAIALQNAGTSTVQLWDGLWTIFPKASLTLNVTKDMAIMDTQNIRVTFDTSTGSVNRLEILLFKSKPC